ncbi:MAG: ParA family protein [Chloroflexi bacterium]|nr:ParA family protein [Chloroflexota bacterium]
MTITIAVNNQKGGVAKTTTCLSLGACLAEMGKMVLLIDMDPQTNLTLSFGLEPNKLPRTVDNVLLGNVSVVSASRESGVFGLDIVPAQRGLALLNKILYKRQNYEFLLKRGLDAMDENLYDVVIIDSPASLDVLTLNALTAADLLVVPVQCEYYAAHSLRQTMELVKLIRKRTNPRLIYRALVTMYDRRNRICRIMFDQMQREMRTVLFQTVIEVDTKLKESPVFHQPITLYAPDTRGAQQYRAFAKELMNHG